MKKVNLNGLKFNRLQILNEIDNKLLCQCDCGTIKLIIKNKVKSGKIKSCGCLNQEMRSSRVKKMTQARQKYSPEEASAMKIWKDRYSDGDLSFEKFKNLSALNCYYCNSKPSCKFNESFYDQRRSKIAKENGFFIYNGLDRIDQSKPHNLNNVVTCCKACNMCKRNMNQEEFIKLIEKIYLNIKLK